MEQFKYVPVLSSDRRHFLRQFILMCVILGTFIIILGLLIIPIMYTLDRSANRTQQDKFLKFPLFQGFRKL